MKKIFVNGTFDILHVGHLAMLNYARQLGDHLLVAIDTDNRVKELKGIARPINSQEDRKTHLENLRAVDEVHFFNSEEELTEIIKQYQPDIMVKGSDYRNKRIVGAEHVKEICYYDHTGHSTTGLIQRITDR